MNSISRRRFFIDLSFVGGALALAAGVAIAGKGHLFSGATPGPEAPQHEIAGKMMVAPPTPQGQGSNKHNGRCTQAETNGKKS